MAVFFARKKTEFGQHLEQETQRAALFVTTHGEKPRIRVSYGKQVEAGVGNGQPLEVYRTQDPSGLTTLSLALVESPGGRPCWGREKAGQHH